MLLIYTILYSLVFIVLAPFEYLRRPKHLRSRWLRERLGVLGAKRLSASGRQVIWIHAVSVGETAAAVALVKGLKARHPSAEVIISTVTDTGQKVATERLGNIARIIYVPFDLPFCVSSAIRDLDPSLFIIMETELWPNIIRAMKRRGIPVLLMNGRISRKSFSGYMKIRFFVRPMLEALDSIGAQMPQYAERFIAMGAAAGAVSVTGNLKFDMTPATHIPEWTSILKPLTIIAGSTHQTEEEIVLDAYEEQLSSYPDLNLILAPRHPQRFSEVEGIVKKRGLCYIKRSQIKGDLNTKEYSGEDCGVIVILDVIGELGATYGAADIAVMGGSFIPHGGQNPLEPAYWGKAIVCGPHMENFPFMDEFYLAGAARRATAAALSAVIGSLLASKEERTAAGRAAEAFFRSNSGATGRTINIVEQHIKAN